MKIKPFFALCLALLALSMISFVAGPDDLAAPTATVAVSAHPTASVAPHALGLPLAPNATSVGEYIIDIWYLCWSHPAPVFGSLIGLLVAMLFWRPLFKLLHVRVPHVHVTWARIDEIHAH